MAEGLEQKSKMLAGRKDVTVFGVLNVTEDSFSDGGRFLDPDQAVAQGLELRAEGADVIDIGAASSHPEALAVSAEEEVSRLTPVVRALLTEGVPVSVDSWQPEVQRWAMGQGVAWLNDIRGFPDAAILREAAASSVGLVAMHSVTGGTRAVREKLSVAQVLESIDRWFEDRAKTFEAAGIDPGRVVLDPGMGLFLGGDEQASLAVLASYRRWADRFDSRLMVAVSRKSIIGWITGKPVEGRQAGSLAAELFAIDQGARCVRTHEPGALHDALLVREALNQRNP